MLQNDLRRRSNLLSKSNRCLPRRLGWSQGPPRLHSCNRSPLHPQIQRCTATRSVASAFLPRKISRTPAGGAAGVAFEAGAVADQREVAAFIAAVAFVALEAGSAYALEAEILGRHR